MGIPATVSMGFGVVSVCGRKREPRPAMGTMIFIFSFYFQIMEQVLVKKMVKNSMEYIPMIILLVFSQFYIFLDLKQKLSIINVEQ